MYTNKIMSFIALTFCETFCVCTLCLGVHLVCVCVREREREQQKTMSSTQNDNSPCIIINILCSHLYTCMTLCMLTTTLCVCVCVLCVLCGLTAVSIRPMAQIYSHTHSQISLMIHARVFVIMESLYSVYV